MKRLLSLLVLLGSALPAVAHPVGNRGDLGNAASFGFLHPLTGMDHFLVMVAVGLWAVQLGGRALWALPIAFVVSMILGGAAGLSVMQTPMVEHGILASLVLLGVALGIAWRPRLSTTVGCVAAAGFCHGYAHGVEIPAGTPPLLFLAGMIISTSLIHALGISGGHAAGKLGFRFATRIAGILLLAFGAYELGTLL